MLNLFQHLNKNYQYLSISGKSASFKTDSLVMETGAFLVDYSYIYFHIKELICINHFETYFQKWILGTFTY
ncbi:MAG: hypothetical protein JXA60_07765, partial [Candidatus Coatesbacteria bacterium]|nr:hypothetical protein [Candidatus Coatesbacteria bacterium]